MSNRESHEKDIYTADCGNHTFLIGKIRNIVSQARSLTVRNVNALQVASNYFIGQHIVDFEQGGDQRAKHGKSLLKELSIELTAEFGRGYSVSNLEYMRKFFLTYFKTHREFPDSVWGISFTRDNDEIRDTVCDFRD